MATPRFAWGIDIGNRALKAVKLVPGADGLVIDDFDVVEHETVLSAAGDNRDALIQTALATFVSRHSGIDKGLVGIGVPGKSAFAKFVPLPPVEKKKIPEIVRFEAMQQIPFPLDDVEWSYQLFEDPGSPDIEVGIFAMRRELVNQNIKFFTDAKLNVQVVQMNPLAVYNGMYYDSRVKGTTMIVDLGAENTDLIIASGESVWLRSISIGGNQFTEALTKAFKVPFDKAEELKRNASTSKYGRQIMQAMRPIFSDLVSEIQRSIGFYSSVHKENRVSRVVALGSTFRLPGLQKYLQQNLSMEVEKLDRLSNGVLEDARAGSLFSDNILSAAGAYGLALQVMGQGKIGSNLLPAEIRKEKMWKEKTKWFAAAAALVVIGTGIGYGRQMYESNQFKSTENTDKFSKIESVLSTATRQGNAWKEVESGGADDRLIAANTLGLEKYRMLWPQVLDSMVAALPQNLPNADPRLKSSKIEDLKKIKRGDRNQIVIEAMVSHYWPDMSEMLKQKADSTDGLGSLVDYEGLKNVPTGMSLLGAPERNSYTPSRAQSGNGPNNGNGGPPAEPVRGFVVTMKVITPHAEGAEIIVKMTEALKAHGVTTSQPFEYRMVAIPKFVSEQDRTESLIAAWKQAETERLREESLSPAGGASGGGAGGATPAPDSTPTMSVPGAGSQNYPQAGVGLGGGMGRVGDRGGMPNLTGGSNGGGGGTASEKLPKEAYEDPVMKEDGRGDTECYVVAAIVLDPPAAKPAPGKGPGNKTVAAR